MEEWIGRIICGFLAMIVVITLLNHAPSPDKYIASVALFFYMIMRPIIAIRYEG